MQLNYSTHGPGKTACCLCPTPCSAQFLHHYGLYFVFGSSSKRDTLHLKVMGNKITDKGREEQIHEKGQKGLNSTCDES